MKIKTACSRWVLAIASLWLHAQLSFGAVQTFENFDTNWPTLALGSATNMLVNNWLVTSGTVFKTDAANYISASNVLYLYNDIVIPGLGHVSSVRTPYLTNGVGTLIFYMKAHSSAVQIFAVELSPDGSTWATNNFITNSSTAFAPFTNTLNSLTDHYVRIRRTDSASSYPHIDNIAIYNPRVNVTLGPPATSPSTVQDQTPANVNISVTMQSVPDTPLQVTNWWRQWPSNNWQSIAMASNQPSSYGSLSQIPGRSTGTRIEYYVSANYQQDNLSYTNYSSTNYYVVLPKSSYTNLAVIGQLSAPLGNGANYQWQNVIYVTNANPTFLLQGISNGITTTWGDINQTVTNIPLYGQAEVTSSNITLYTTNTGYYLFSFSETDLTYSVRSCVYEHFGSWTSATYNTFGTYTNPATGWILSSGNTSNDNSRLYGTTGGRSAIVETNGWIQTPYLTNGLGQISFWFRNWPTNGTPTGKFIVQSSDSSATNWVTLGTVSNIVSTNYLFFSMTTNDTSSKYVRIQNTQTAATARLCFDEVIVSQSGAGVNGTNLVTTPTSPTYMDPISIAVDLSAYNGALISNNVTAWYRIGDTGAWETKAMTSMDGTHYTLSTPLTGVPVGNLYYTVQINYSGFQAASPVFFPAGGTNNPATNSVSIPIANILFQNFDTNWTTRPLGTATNMLVNNWLVTSGTVFKGSAADYTSASNVLYLYNDLVIPGLGYESSVRTPYLTNGVGTLTFYMKAHSTAVQIFAIELSSNGSSWSTNNFITNSSTAFVSFTNTINSLADRYVRIRRTDSSGVYPHIDDILVTYPPANAAITNVFINPGYPVAGQTFTASCDVVTLNPFFPAYNIAPQFIYWPVGGALTTGTMSRAWISGTTNHYVFAVSLPASTRDTPYSYYVKAAFDGYYGSSTENQSPKFSDTRSFTVREYAAAYSNLTTIVNTTNEPARLVSDSIWQSVVNITNSALTFSFQGQGYFTNNSYLTNLWTFGNSNVWQTAIPLSDMAATGQPPVSVAASNGQYVVRFDESTGQYLVNSCVFQDFDKPGEGNGDVYKRTQVSSTVGGASQSFDYWATNTTRVRAMDFTSWTPFSYWTNGNGSNAFFVYNGRIDSARGLQTYTNTPVEPNNEDYSFIAQASHFFTNPLRGIGEISYNYAAEYTNTPKRLWTYLAPTNYYLEPTNNAPTYPDFQTLSSYWKGGNPIIQTDNITNSSLAAFFSTNYVVATNATMDVVISQTAPGSNSVFIKTASVSEWYSEPLTTNADGWVGSGYFITQNGITPGNCCLLDRTRTADPDNQYIRTPLINSGIKSLEFYYGGSSYLSGSTNIPISFTVEQGSGTPISWTNMVAISTNFLSSRTNFFYYSTNLNTSAAGLYIRIRNTTARPNALLLDRINIPGYATTNSWSLNNAAPDYDEQQYPPLPRQYYRGVCFLNNTTNQYMETGTNAPDITRPAYIRTPYLSGGIGEISFRYRNWSTNGMAVTPGKIVVQAAPEDRFESDWATAVTIATITNIVNTNTYAFFQTAIYDESNRYVRIYNYNPLTDPTSSVGRVCIDEVLVTAPMAAKLSLSNLVITPTIPLYTNSVDVSVDVYNLFLNPTIVGMTACYATATSYAGLSSATYTSIPMTCVTSSIAGTRQWYRYRTAPSSIPAQPTDTFIKYYAKAAYTGYMASVTSPKTNAAFGIYPSWLAPLDTQNGTNLAYYVVYSCPTGSVWINEINPIGYTAAATNQEFIELCAPEGIDLSGWYIDDILPSLATQAVYQIASGTIISNISNGFGFWVIGGNAVSSRDMTLTQKIGYPAGIRLRRPSGIYEHAVCFGDTLGACGDLPSNGFTYIGKDVSISYRVLTATGTGTLANAFTSWVNTFTNTARAVNFNQFLGDIPLWSPTIRILGFQIGTNIWIMCTSTNNWHPVPWSTTNLMVSNSWSSIASSNYTSVETSSNCVLNIQKATNSSPYFYKIVATNSP